MNVVHTKHPILVALAVLALVLVSAPAVMAQTALSAEADRPKVDLNTASQADLERLPGIGAVMARQIVDGRPYSSVADLSKSGAAGPYRRCDYASREGGPDGQSRRGNR